MITAGMDTTAISVEWAVAELVRNPEVQAKAQEELDQVKQLIFRKESYVSGKNWADFAPRYGILRSSLSMACKFECKFQGSVSHPI